MSLSPECELEHVEAWRSATCDLQRPRFRRNDASKLRPGVDTELAEDLGEVVLNRARADEQVGRDLLVPRAFSSHSANLSLLGRQLVLSLDGALTSALPCRPELDSSPLGKRLESHRLKLFQSLPQLVAR